MDSAKGYVERTADRMLELHRDDVIDEVCDWLGSDAADLAISAGTSTVAPVGRAAARAVREHCGRG